MAIQKQLETNYGVTFTECYLIVESTTFIKGEFAQGNLLGYANKAAREAGKDPVYHWAFSFIYDYNLTKNIIEQAYDAVKLNENFLDAIDV